jgi:hypothetical protein
VLNILHANDDETSLILLLGILNSKLISLFYKQRAVKGARTLFPKIVIKNLREFPYPKTISNALKTEIGSATTRMLDLNKRAAAAKAAPERTVIQRQIEATDQQIDRLVYALYGLTEDEIRIVEEATK